MSILLMAASGLMALPETISHDYPIEALQNERSAAAAISMLVDTKGKIVRCEIKQEFGDPKLSAQICDLQKRHKPATDENGEPIHGMINSIVKYWLPDTKVGDQIAILADGPLLTLPATNLPAEAEGKIDTRLIFHVDEVGEIVACQTDLKDETEKPYAEAACQQFTGHAFGVQKGRDDQPVAYVRDLRIRFSEAG